MTLYELLKASPLAKLARRAALDEAACPMTVKQRKKRTQRYLYFLGSLLVSLPASDSPYLLVPTPYCDDGIWKWEAALIEAEDFAILMSNHPPLPLHSREELTAMTLPELEAAGGALRDCLPPAVDYAFLPWDDILGAGVHLPPAPGRPLLSAFLSSILRTMSYAGFTKTQQSESRKRLLALMEARGEVKRLSNEEMEKRQSSLRTLFPAPPRKEQEDTDRALLIDTVLSLEGEYKMYKSLAE